MVDGNLGHFVGDDGRLRGFGDIFGYTEQVIVSEAARVVASEVPNLKPGEWIKIRRNNQDEFGGALFTMTSSKLVEKELEAED